MLTKVDPTEYPVPHYRRQDDLMDDAGFTLGEWSGMTFFHDITEGMKGVMENDL